LILLPESAWDAFLAAGKRHGFEPRVPDALALARELRMLLLRHTPSGVDIDISVGSLLFEEEALARGQHRKVGGVLLLLPTPEDLIIMKAVAHRESWTLTPSSTKSGYATGLAHSPNLWKCLNC